MFLEIGPTPEDISADLRQRLMTVGVPTLGHYLEEGFVSANLRRLSGTTQVVGPAMTVRTTATDSTLLHHAAGLIEPGYVMVIDTGGDRIHAPLGEVVATQLAVSNAAGVIVDGVVTDIDEIRALGLAVYAHGTSALTTKLHGIDAGGG